MDFYEERQRLQSITASVRTSRDAIDVDKLKQELQALEAKRADESFWQDVEHAKSVNMRVAQIERSVEKIERLEKKCLDLSELIDMAEGENDPELENEITELTKTLEQESEQLFLESLLRGKYDSLNAILTIHAGAGGTEAQDWTEMLYRMYTRYAERKGYGTETTDRQDGDEAGIKSVTFTIKGDNAYGFLKAEKGVHRLVRISPFDAGKRRHTSFASVEVMPEIIDDNEIVIRPEELKIDTCRSSGAGGQHVNKTESAVRITHLPTGIVTWCQNERSQVQNKETAMKMLYAKLAELKEREQTEEALKLKGEIKKIEWGSQIRSYVFCPYTMVKDHRTGYETSDVNAVMDGDLDGFIYDYLVKANS